MKKEMLINVLQPEECRIAILENGVLEELYVERTSHESYVGNIYKGRIVNIEPSIQAAFVDFGVGRNGFLHVSDVEPTYFLHLEQRGDRGGRGDRGDRRGRDRDRDRDRGHDRDRGRPAYIADFDFGEEDEPVAAAGEPESPGMADFLAGVALEPGVPREPGGAAPAEPEATAPEAAPASPEAPPAPEETEEKPLGAPLMALPETQIEEDTGRPRRKSRGTTGRRKRTS